MRRVESDALLLRSVAYGESDLIVTLLTEAEGKWGAMIRGGRKSSHRVGGALEPFHVLRVALDDRGGELAVLREAHLHKVRGGLVASLAGMEAAGTAMRWARHLFPPRTPEPDGWLALGDLLDALDGLAVEGVESDAMSSVADVELAAAGFRLLAGSGYGLDFDACVTCGRPCPEGRPAAVNIRKGGIVCQACGGGPAVVGPEIRKAARRVSQGERMALDARSARALVALVEEAMAIHADFET